jgi:hypothetical protein
MRLTEFKYHLNNLQLLNFFKHNRQAIPPHFHITEAGVSSKQFIDCSGNLRAEKLLSLQIWIATDYHHRLSPKKLLQILAIYEKQFGSEDLEIEIEFQSESVSLYGLDIEGGNFMLIPKQTSCLAADHCGIPKQRLSLSSIKAKNPACCRTESNCS